MNNSEEPHPVCEIPKEMTCLATWDDISLEEGNYCEYRSVPSKTWQPAKYSSEIVQHLLETQFPTYMQNVEKASSDCAAAVRRLISKGPPIWLEDKNALPIPEEDTHIDQVWFSGENGGKLLSAQLKEAPINEDREQLWESQKAVLRSMELAEAQDKETAEQ
eukprot:maker-scaffold_13-snap-gene-4.3-mRNA-1 protein AED:0.02 eAED:0.02 QI:62/1/1/1/1/1/2/155/161